jgi:hypothetical protein
MSFLVKRELSILLSAFALTRLHLTCAYAYDMIDYENLVWNVGYLNESGGVGESGFLTITQVSVYLFPFSRACHIIMTITTLNQWSNTSVHWYIRRKSRFRRTTIPTIWSRDMARFLFSRKISRSKWIMSIFRSYRFQNPFLGTCGIQQRCPICEIWWIDERVGYQV